MRAFVLLVILPLLLSACDPRPKSMREDPQKILDELQAEVGPDVTGPEKTQLQAAVTAEKNRQFGRALQFYRQLRDYDAENVYYMVGVANNLRRTGKFGEALQGYDLALTQEPENISALEGKALALMGEGKFDEARPLFQQVLGMDKKRWRTLNGIGVLFALKNLPDQAVAYYDQAASVVPEQPAIYNNKGLTLALKDDFDGAIAALERASTLLAADKGEQARADLNLALVYGLKGDMDDAERVADKHLNDAALNNNLGFYAYLADNRDLAKAYLNTALSGSPVFYEKAAKNLELLGGSQMSGSNGDAKVPAAIPNTLGAPATE